LFLNHKMLNIKSKHFYLIAFLMIAAFAVLAAGCGGANEDGSSGGESSGYEVRWATMGAGSSIQVISSAMLEDIKKDNSDIIGQVLPGSPESNLIGVHEGQFNMGHSLSDISNNAWNGKEAFDKEIQDTRNLATLYPHFSHIVVWADSGINDISDLKGKRIITGPNGTSSEFLGKKVLELYGISYDDVEIQFLNFADGPQQFIDGYADALLYTSIPFTFPAILNVASHKKIKLLEMPDDIIQKISENFGGLNPFTLPANTYPEIDYPVKGISSRAHIIVRDDMPDEIAYKITKSIAENFDRYGDVHAAMKRTTLAEMANDASIPFHPGALKYYQEAGMKK